MRIKPSRWATIAVVALIVGSISPAEASSFTISSTLSKSWMTLGTTVEMSGDVSPAVKNKTIYVQERIDYGTWRTIKKTYANGSGHFRTVITPPYAGKFQYRAKTLALGSRTGDVSIGHTVSVYTWIRLSMLLNAIDDDLPPVPPAPQTIGGTYFADSWESAADGTGHQFYPTDIYNNRSRKASCWKLRGTVGLDDDSAPPARGVLTIDTPSASYDFPAVAGSLTSMVLDISGRTGLDLTAQRTGPAVDTIVAIGNPRVFCTTESPTYFQSH
jgi:hypothetical protein